MKILVTGAAGFIGFHVARELSADPLSTIVCVDNRHEDLFDQNYKDLIAKPNVLHCNLDLCDWSAVSKLPVDIEEIYHFAAINGTANFYERSYDVLRSATLPTINLVHKFGPLAGVRRFIYAGSSESYASTVADFRWTVPTSEDVPLSIADLFNPRWSYAMGKMHGEMTTIAGGRQFDMPFTILRFHNVYGERMGDKHVIPDFYLRARKGVLALYGHEQTRSFIYIEDAVRATLLSARSARTIDQVFNLGGTREITMRELGKLMMEAANLTGEIELHPAPPGSVLRRCPDTTKIQRATGFQERYSLEDGLRRTSEYYLR